MKNFYGRFVALFLAGLLTILLAGCGGGNSGGETEPTPAQTGDTTLFPNAQLLASAAEPIPAQTIVLDARTSIDQYNAGHIPGAIFAPPSDFEKDGILLSPAELAEVIAAKGITISSKIIIYDNSSALSGTAGRLFWILEYMGCTDVKILNGGWYQWTQYNPDMVSTAPTTMSPQPVTLHVNDTVEIASKTYVYEHFATSTDAGYILIDMRTNKEYQEGHIPGAINFPYDECFNADKTVLNFKDLKALLVEYGVAVDKEMVVYSNKGYRGCFFYFLCRLMGFSNIVSYIGSSEDWLAANPDAYTLVTGSNPY